MTDGRAGRPADVAAARVRFVVALGDVDRQAALTVVRELLDAGVPAGGVLTDLVAPAQREVGERWVRGDWNVAQEHAATAISEAAVALVAAARRPRPPGAAVPGRVAVACVEGEWHAMPARLVAESLTELGWDVTYLGASVPPSHLAQFLHDTGPDAVALSCSLPSNLPAARDVVAAARSAGVPVLVGGRAFGTDGARAAAVGADGWAPDPATAADLLRTWEPRLSPSPVRASAGAVEAERLTAHLPVLVEEVLRGGIAGLPGLREAADRGALDPGTDVEHLLRAVAAGMLLADPTVATEALAWWTTVLVARGVPPEAADRVAPITAGVLEGAGLTAAARSLRAR